MLHEEIDSRLLSVIMNILYEEYESMYYVDTATNRMEILKVNSELAISESVEYTKNLPYDQANNWYVDTYVLEDDKDRMRREVAMDEVLRNLESSDIYYVNYKRIHKHAINYNQLVYTRIPEDQGLHGFLMGFRDIDKRKEAQIDGVTGLYNRSAFLLHARKMLVNNPDKKYELIMSDFVDFKRINEQYGSEVGDKMLAAYGKYLRTRNMDNMMLAGRFGGDQFVALVEHSIIENWILGGADTSRILEEGYPDANVKFGVYRIEDTSVPVSLMCDRAHLALENIKRTYGVVLAVFNDEIKKKVENQRIIENSMRDALVSDQFKVYYQPKHNAETGKIIGAEALIRWIHPEYGFMSPADFIPLFEKNGFVTEADKYVLETTCKNIKKWIDMGITMVPVSVNASRSDFLNDNMVDTFNTTVDTNHISRDLIHIEITESLMEENTELLIETLGKLRDEGYQIELDDFGAGYSSINALSEFPIDVVKLDMSFMKQIDDEKRTKVLSSCINLAKNLGYKTVSEGVETQRQQEILKEFGVDAIQGYYYSKPLSEADFEEYLKQNAL